MKGWYAAAIMIALCTISARGSAGLSTLAASETSYDLIVCNDPGSPAHAVGVGLELLIKLELLPTAGVNVASSTSSGGESCVLEMMDRASTFAIMDHTVLKSAHGGSRPSGEEADVRPLLVAALWPQAAHSVVTKTHLLSGTTADFALLSTDQLSVDPALRNGAARLLAKAGIKVDRQADNRRPALSDMLVEDFNRGALIGFAVLEPVPSPTVTEFLMKTGDQAALLELSERHVLADGQGWRPLRGTADGPQHRNSKQRRRGTLATRRFSNSAGSSLP